MPKSQAIDTSAEMRERAKRGDTSTDVVQYEADYVSQRAARLLLALAHERDALQLKVAPQDAEIAQLKGGRRGAP